MARQVDLTKTPCLDKGRKRRKETALPTAEAHVATRTPSRYVAQLCRHLDHTAKTRPELGARVEWSEDRGLADLGWGRCLIDADAEVLTLIAQADDEAALSEVQILIGALLERMGRHERLVVTWETDPGRDDRTDKPQGRKDEWLSNHTTKMRGPGSHAG